MLGPFKAETLREIMVAYDTMRACWIEKHGTAQGYDEWFSNQVMGEKSKGRAQS